jgi:hypothetical protein
LERGMYSIWRKRWLLMELQYRLADVDYSSHFWIER